LKVTSAKVQSMTWDGCPLVSLMIYVISFSIGFGPLPWAVNAEIHPPESKSMCSAIAYMVNWMCAFLVTKFQTDLEDAINTWGSYFLFGSICAVGTVFVVLFVPETKGKTSEEIRQLFDKNAKVPEVNYAYNNDEPV